MGIRSVAWPRPPEARCLPARRFGDAALPNPYRVARLVNLRFLSYRCACAVFLRPLCLNGMSVHKQRPAPIDPFEERFHFFVQALQDYALFMLDPEGNIATWNTGAERIKGYQASEIIGRHFSCFYPEEDLAARKPWRELEVAAREGRFEDEGWRIRKDGSRFWASVIITAVRDDSGTLVGFGKVTRDLTERKQNEDELRRKEQRFRLLVGEVQDYAIFMLDPEGYILTWNLGAQRIKGYLPSEIIGKHFSCFYPQEDLALGKPAQGLETAAKVGRFETEGWRVRKDGSKFWANVVITALRDSDGNLTGFGKVTRDFTERMLAQKALENSQRKLQDSEKALRDLSLHLLRSQDEERRRIGREIHDSVGQYLSVLKMKLDSMSSFPDAAKQAADCADLADECLTEVRTISYLLYPPMLEEMGLKSAIPWYLEGFSKRSKVKTRFDISPNFGRLPPDAELALFRVLQESLTNVQRHSGSALAEIRLFQVNGTVHLQVNDEGNGLPAEILEQGVQNWATSLGVGLRGMSERLRQLGGDLKVISDENGTQVCATVPVGKETSAAASRRT